MIGYAYLDDGFLQAMNEIGEYGFLKYGENSFQSRRCQGDFGRGNLRRVQTEQIIFHGSVHFFEYYQGRKHDHFDDTLHHLAAVAFNAMMEYMYAVNEKGRK
jgi:hypothetical protein